MLPTIFVSHGAPNLILQDVPARHFLADLGVGMPRPRAVVAVTAHWETRRPMAGSAAHPAPIHDFGGFDERLYQMKYPSPVDPALAARIVGLLDEGGLQGAVDPARGLDHGVWVPMMLM